MADEEKETRPLDGTWAAVTAELAGQAFPENVTKSITLEIKGDHYKVTVGQQPDEGTVRMIPNQDPKAMDITGTEGPNKGRTFLAIYQLKGDSLTVCYDLAGKERPKEFKTKAQTKQFLVRYERKK